MTVRLNEDGKILVYPVYSKITGEVLQVDDRTFDPEIHSVDEPEKAAKSKKAKGE